LAEAKGRITRGARVCMESPAKHLCRRAAAALPRLVQPPS
jgi:hypothetical protein